MSLQPILSMPRGKDFCWSNRTGDDWFMYTLPGMGFVLKNQGIVWSKLQAKWL